MIKYREYTIHYDDPGVTIRREVPNGYGPKVVYRKSFKSLFEGLNYLSERIMVTDGGELDAAVKTLKNFRSDMTSIIKRIPINHEKETIPEIILNNNEDSSFIIKDTPKKIVKKVVKKA